MMKKVLNSLRGLWIGCPVVLALASAVLRRWQLAAAFEGELGLLVHRAPATVILTCVLIITAALLLMMAVRQEEYTPPRGAQHKFLRQSGMTAQGDTVSLTITVIAAFLALAAAPVLFRQGMQLREGYRMAAAMGFAGGGNNGLLMMATAATSILAFAGLLLAGRDRFRGIRNGKGEPMIMLAAVNSCLWLMEIYRGNAADPVLWDYVPLLLAVICGMLFYMDCAGLACGAYHPRRTLWLAGMTVVLSATALAGNWDLGSAILLVSQVLSALAVLWRLPMNMEHPPAVEQPQVLEEEIQEEDEHV